MAKVYTFPDQDTIAGTLGFEFTVSNGTGTQTLDSKFFSSEFSCGSQTEFFAGDLQSVFADFIVDNDEDLLFSGEILPAMNDGAYVTVKVTLDGDVFFRGSIEPTTISSFTINTTNDALDNEKTGYKFRCNWVFSLLKEITTGQLFTQINSDKTKYKVFNIPSRFSSTASPGGTSLSMVPLSGIINAILDLFTANYGYTIDYSNDSSDMIFVSEPSSEYKKKYFFPNYFQNNLNPFEIIFGSQIGTIDTVGLMYMYSDGTKAGYFDSNSDFYISNCYDFLVAIPKSLGIYLNVTYSLGSDLAVALGTRTSGSDKTPTIANMLSIDGTPFSELGRDAVDITTAVTGNSEIRNFYGASNNKYTERFDFDFGNDNDMPGGNGNSEDGQALNTVYSLMLSDSGNQTFDLVRVCGVGADQLTNGNFDGSLTGWTEASGTWSAVTETVYGNLSTYAKVTIASGGNAEITQTVDSIPTQFDKDERIFGCIVATSAPLLELVLTVYDSNGGTAYQETLNIIGGGLRLLYLSETFQRQRYPLETYSIKVNNASAFSYDVYVTGVFLKFKRVGTPAIVGKLIQNYFGNGLLRPQSFPRKKIVCNGINRNLQLKDYITLKGLNYYIKGLTFNFNANETEIDAINYPY